MILRRDRVTPTVTAMFVLQLAFTDDPHRLAARPDHRRRLAELSARGIVEAAGPYSDDSGAMLVLDTDEHGLGQVLRDDPYYSTPGVMVVSVRSWTPLDLDAARGGGGTGRVRGRD